VGEGAMKTPDKVYVGIWWWINGVIYKYVEDVETLEDDGSFLCVEQEHIKYWKILQESNPELKLRKYDDFSRGRVWYHKVKKQYSITCSDEFTGNQNGFQAVKDSFDLNTRRLQIVVDQQYIR
jgi:hypothetical protein